MSQCLLYYIYRVYIVFICVFFLFIIMADAILVFLKLNILFTMTGLLIGMRVYVNCVCRLLRFLLEKIRNYLFLLLHE